MKKYLWWMKNVTFSDFACMNNVIFVSFVNMRVFCAREMRLYQVLIESAHIYIYIYWKIFCVHKKNIVQGDVLWRCRDLNGDADGYVLWRFQWKHRDLVIEIFYKDTK